MFWYIGVMISGMIAGFGAVWRYNCYHKKRKDRKITEYRKSSESNELTGNESTKCETDFVSNEKYENNDKLSTARYSPFPLLDGLDSKKKSNLIMKEPIKVLDSAKIIQIVNSQNYYSTKHFDTWSKIISSSDTDDSDELCEVFTHNDNCVIQFSI